MSHKYGCIACDVGGTNIRVSQVGNDLTITGKLKEPAGHDHVAVLTRLIDNMLKKAAAGLPVKGIGVAVAGITDSAAGIVLRSPNIPGLKGFDLKKHLSGLFGLPVIVENDANAAAYGEKCSGTGREFSDFVMLTLGTGIGGGIVADNRLLPVSAEIGHMTIETDGIQCSCGSRGCLEAYASASAIIRNAVSAIEKGVNSRLKNAHDGDFHRINAGDIYVAAKEGDPLADLVLREAGKSLGIGIANAINILSPQAVILTGGLIGAWDIYIEAAVAEASKRAMPELFERVRIVGSTLGDDAGTIGVASLVFHHIK